MDLNFLKDKGFAWFVIKFFLVFTICYYGTLAVIGLSVPGGHYSPFVDKYLDYISWIRSSLLYGTKYLLAIFGVDTYMASQYNIRQVNGRGIIIVYECVGYGIMSFWIAFVAASGGALFKKFGWIISGLIFFWLLNITRLSLLLVATNKGWGMPLGWDHHTWFSIVAYSVMLLMIYLYNKREADERSIKRVHNAG